MSSPECETIRPLGLKYFHGWLGSYIKMIRIVKFLSSLFGKSQARLSIHTCIVGSACKQALMGALFHN